MRPLAAGKEAQESGGSAAIPYLVAQVLGGIAGAALLWLIGSGKPGFSLSGGFEANGYGAHSPGGYSLLAALVCEFAITFIFLMVILDSTDKRAPKGMAPIAGALLAGLCSGALAKAKGLTGRYSE